MRSTETRIAGVTFKNPDGTDRQSLLRDCKIGDAVRLAREPQNPHDRNAVAILRSDGRQIGYVASEKAQHVARKLDANLPYNAQISELGEFRGESGERLVSGQITIDFAGSLAGIAKAKSRPPRGKLRPRPTPKAAPHKAIWLIVLGVCAIAAVVLVRWPRAQIQTHDRPGAPAHHTDSKHQR